MSPSRRRAIGAVRGLASCAPLCAGLTGRRALRGYRGAHGDAPGKTLNVCYLPFSTRITRAARCLAAGPPGSCPTAITPAWGAPQLPERITRAARWGHRALPPLHPRGVHPTPKNLCAPIHPAPSLFVLLCVKNTHPRPRIARTPSRTRRPAPSPLARGGSTLARGGSPLPTGCRASRPRPRTQKTEERKCFAISSLPHLQAIDRPMKAKP